MKKIAVVTMFVVVLVAAACAPAPASVPAFPVGKLLLQGSQSRALQFNQDGSFVALDGAAQLAAGTYSVKGDVFTEESNDQACPSPRHYKYTFDGANLVFHPVEDPATDPCDGRRTDFSEQATWVIAK